MYVYDLYNCEMKVRKFSQAKSTLKVLSEPKHGNSYNLHIRQAKTQINLRIRAV